MIGGTIILLIICIGYSSSLHPEILFIPNNLTDTTMLFLLTSICTALMYFLILQVLKEVSAFTVGLAYNLEPVYSIIFAILFFEESKELSTAFCVGLILIILSVGLQTLDVLKNKKTQPH